MRSGAATAGLAALSAALGLLMASRSYAAEASSPSPPLTRVAQVRSLTPTEVARGWRVELTGVITFSDPNRQLLCLQDATGGLFVFPQTRGWDYRVGQEMKVTGEVAPGEHLPCVSQAVLQPLGLAALPVPRAVTADHLATDVEDANWVEVHGVGAHRQPPQRASQPRNRHSRPTAPGPFRGAPFGPAGLDRVGGRRGPAPGRLRDGLSRPGQPGSALAPRPEPGLPGGWR